MTTIEHISSVSNAAAPDIGFSQPYAVFVRITGSSSMLLHRWNNEAVAEKASAAKGSVAKKTDNVESYVYRNDDGVICLPGEYVRQSVCGKLGSAKFRQDPRSPRKSALDLYKAGLVVLTELAPIRAASGEFAHEWDFLDQRRVEVQRQGITRSRPAFRLGWSAEMVFEVVTPEYIKPTELHEVLNMAGRLVGVADMRPTYGRFAVTNFEVMAVTE